MFMSVCTRLLCPWLLETLINTPWNGADRALWTLLCEQVDLYLEEDKA